MLTTMKTCLAIVALVLTLEGCNGRIPNSVSADEYEIYSEWLKVHFVKEAPGNLYISSRTFVFDPLKETNACRTGMPLPLIKQLHALGEAEYRLPDAYSPARLGIPWNYKIVDDWRLVSEESGSYRLIAFSRIAFDTTHKNALFAVSDACGGLCGHGGAVYAHKQNGAWVFEDGGCNWLY
jgi:hypothetical protein